jgi:hypothetical protein
MLHCVNENRHRNKKLPALTLIFISPSNLLFASTKSVHPSLSKFDAIVLN